MENLVKRSLGLKLSGMKNPNLETVPKEYFPSKLVVKIEEDHYQYVATRVQLNKLSVAYYGSLNWRENLDSVEEILILDFSRCRQPLWMLRLKMPTVI